MAETGQKLTDPTSGGKIDVLVNEQKYSSYHGRSFYLVNRDSFLHLYPPGTEDNLKLTMKDAHDLYLTLADVLKKNGYTL